MPPRRDLRQAGLPCRVLGLPRGVCDPSRGQLALLRPGPLDLPQVGLSLSSATATCRGRSV